MKKFISKISLVIVVLFVFTSILSGSVFSADTSTDGKVKVLITFNSQPGLNEQALVHAFGGTISHTYTLVPAIAASIPEVALRGLQKNPRVLRIEADVTVYAIGELADTWGVQHIGSGEVHSGGNTGSGVKVAILDSGIDKNHPDLNANYAGGYDFVNNDEYPMDDNGHGTHVAGTIAAVYDKAGVVGVAPDASIYALKVLDSSGSGYFSDIIAALEWCVAHGIKVTNNSYGSSGDPGLAAKAAFDNAYAAGIINIASAGNNGNAPGRGDNVGYPGAYDSVIAVAATDSSDVRARFSSTGPDVELSAPGVSILSTVLYKSYAYYSGTSMASPHVAGVAALIIRSGVTDPAEIRSVLQSTAIDLGTAGRDEKYGYGLVDAIKAAGGPVTGTPVVNISAPADGQEFHVQETVTFTGTASDSEGIDLTAGIQWVSDKDGFLGTGGNVSTDILNEGEHTITASATDSDTNTGSASINISVVNDAPVVSIIQPEDGSSFDSGVPITFEGSAIDTEDGVLTDSLSWSSDLVGPIDAGGTFDIMLSDGIHTITASVTDANGATGSSSVTVTIGLASVPADTVSVPSITYWTEGGKGGTAHLRIAVEVVDNLDVPVPGASVSLELKFDGDPYKFLSGVTGSTGTIAFKVNNAPSGTYTSVITSVSADGYEWDKVTPPNAYPE